MDPASAYEVGAGVGTVSQGDPHRWALDEGNLQPPYAEVDGGRDTP
jgi:hypothetical protein